jgi:ceramide glucosyltransferase
LRALSAYASHDLTLISDSNVRVGPDYLRATVTELGDPTVGLVTNPVVGCGEVDTGATFESLHLLTYVARALGFAGAYLGRACVVGKSMLFRRSDLGRLGGWSLVRDVLAEDYLIGHAFEQAGLRVVSSPHVIFTHSRHWPLARFANRHLRWGQMRRRICLPAYLLEPLFNPHALLVPLAALSLASGQGQEVTLPFAGAGMGLRLLADRALWRRMRGAPPPLGTLLLSIPKDLLVMALWAVAGVRRTIDWRGHVMFIGRGTRLERRPTHRTAMEEAT